MKHLGDFDASTVVYGKFTTFRPSTGATFTLGGTPALSVYKDNSLVQSTTGVTLTVDFDSVTGLHHFAIDTSADGTFYSAGSFFSIVITTGTVDSVSVVGTVVAEFTIRKNSALKPTTAARTLDVSATGEAGIDWANIGSPTTAVNLSATNIDVDQVVASVSGAVGSVTGAVGSVTGNVGGSVGSVATGGITRASLAADTGLQSVRSNTAQAGAVGTITLDAAASAVDGYYNDTVVYLTGGTGIGQVRHISAYVGATKVATIKPNWATAPDATSTFAILSVTSPWDHVTADHLDSGSTGASLNAAGSAGDPWLTALPGVYGAGTAGNIVGNNLNATVSSRLASASYTAPLDAAGTATAVWNAATASYGTAGSYGLLIETNVDAQISTRSTMDAISVRTAVGLASANLDTQFAAIPTATVNADTVLARDLGSGTGAGTLNERTVRSALRFLRNKWSISGTTLTVTKENDIDSAWVSTVATDAAAVPVVGSDPS